jgi:hypothetical protein
MEDYSKTSHVINIYNSVKIIIIRLCALCVLCGSVSEGSRNGGEARIKNELQGHYTRWVSCITITLFKYTIFSRSFGRSNSSGESHCCAGRLTKVAFPCVFSFSTTALVAFWSGPI